MTFIPSVRDTNLDATTIYIKGDDTTDGSVRLMLTSGDTIAHIEQRANGVWNDGSLRTASGSVLVGRDLTIAAAAGFIETRNPSGIIGHTRSLIPHIQFDDDGTKQPQTPIVKDEEDFVIYSTAVSETIGTSIGIDLGVSPGRILEESKHEVGTVSATSSVTVSMYLGTDNTGFLMDRRVIPASDMVAGTTVEINYDNDLGFLANQQTFMEFTSASNISLKTDSGGNPLTIHEGHELSSLELVTENLVFDNNLGHVLDNDLNPVYTNQFN